jgi:hypothetical protein
VGSCYSVVCVVRRLRAGRARYHVSTPGIDKIFLFSKFSSPVPMPTKTPTQEAPKPLFLGVKRLQREADHSLSFSDEV